MSEGDLLYAIEKLNDAQRAAVCWENGSLLLLAGPGSGKTQVLTCRIARLVTESSSKSLRILALTFTNKASAEMAERVAVLAPGFDERTLISTFHGFCGQVLRQHGTHLDISGDFAIYSADDDRQAILQDALSSDAARTSGAHFGDDDLKLLALIDRLKSRLIGPENAEKAMLNRPDSSRVAVAYKLYEAELRKNNALDFNSLVLECHKLFSDFPELAHRYQKSYPYWLIDEFQDTTDAQYKLLRAMAGDSFKNLFAVADDDQIIYQWNGASFRQLQRLQADFEARVLQLPTNFRCPPAIVAAANKLVAYNNERSSGKSPLLAGKQTTRLPPQEHIRLRDFDDDRAEARGVAADIFDRGASAWGEIAVLARTRALLDMTLDALKEVGVSAVLAQRRDEFISAELRFLVACLRQTSRPLDKRNFVAMVEAFNRVADRKLLPAQLFAEAEASGRSYFGAWQASLQKSELEAVPMRLFSAAKVLENTPAKALASVDICIEELKVVADADLSEYADLREDIQAWSSIRRDIGRRFTGSLEQFLQELQMRSKEPPPKANTVQLMTVHAAKGKEFDTVYLMGLAEDILPSFQSKQRGDASAEMEEERRNCFVAITRAKECLVLSWAKRYRGWVKAPSRFLVEMGLISTN